MPSLDDDKVTVYIDGREFRGWDSVELSMSIADLADSLTLTAQYDPDLAALVAATEPYKYQSVTLKIGVDTYFTGVLDVLDFTYDSDNTITIKARSKTAILIDCCAEVEDTAEVTALTFAQIAREKVCKRLGITVRDDDPRSATRKIPEARAQYGESAFEYLKRLAAPHNLLLNSSYTGELVITSGDELVKYSERAHLEQGNPIILSAHSGFDATKRGSHYRVASQFAGAPDVLGEAIDSSIKPYRPKCKNGDTTGTTETGVSDPVLTAERFLNESVASSLNISLTLEGWRRPDGKRWSERQIVTLYYPRIRLTKAGRYITSGCSLKYSASDGLTTTLQLLPPELYAGKLVKGAAKVKDLW